MDGQAGWISKYLIRINSYITPGAFKKPGGVSATRRNIQPVLQAAAISLGSKLSALAICHMRE